MEYAWIRLGARSIVSLCGIILVLRSLLSPALAAADGIDISQFTLGWASYNGTYDSQRYSMLGLISKDNVSSLKEVCRVQVDDVGAFHDGPVVLGDTMYVTTKDDTIALDARTCAIRWRTTYKPVQEDVWPANRGAAYLNGRIYRGTGDGRLLALDAKTGEVLWTDVVGDPKLGEYLGCAPIAWNGLVFIGTAGGDFGIKGRMLAFDAVSGKEVWRFNLIPTDKERGADTWPSKSTVAVGGGGTWSSFSLDPVTNEIFVPVGNPAPAFAPASRGGGNLFTDSVVVLNAATGALKWWYQLVSNDGHDADVGAAPMLYRDGQQREMVAVAGKDGYLHAVDRRTHRLRFKVSTTTHEEPTQTTAPTPEGVRICPGILGGTEWNGPAFDAARGLIFVAAVDWCSVLKSTGPGKYAAGQVYFGGDWRMDGPPTGWINAINSDSGKRQWRYHATAPVVSGITATAGGIVLSGDLSGTFRALNSLTGDVLFEYDTGGSIAGGIVTYAVDGRQYIALTSGNLSRITFQTVGRPTIIVMALP